MTGRGKLVIAIAVIVSTFFGLRYGMQHGWIPRPDILKSSVPLGTDEIAGEEIQHDLSKVKQVALPQNQPTTIPGPKINYGLWAWNAQMGALGANGGPFTTKGSLVEKHNVKIQFIRQDDPVQMQNELLTFASALEKGNPHPTVGFHFVAIMGDGAGTFLQGINPKLEKLGEDYIAEVIGSAGKSVGEDGFYGLPEWKNDPQLAKGALIAGYIGDGDWNIAMRFANMNGISNNPDTKTYDPEALNWVAADTYIDASQKYISKYCEDRPVKGKPGQMKNVCVNGVVTWTPGDVMIAEKRGGLVTLLSTKTARWQMPNTIIGIKKWNAANADRVAGMLAAFSEGADQVRTNPAFFRKAAEISTLVYKEQTPEYWMKYYKGVTKKDIQGYSIELGGSTVSNLADVFQLYGLDGGPNRFQATYETWSKVMIQQYPNIMKEFQPTEKILNTRYVQLAATKINMSQANPEETAHYSASEPIQEILGNRNYSINFRTGSDEILPNSFSILNDIYNDLVTSDTKVILHGHTDNTGNQSLNELLSQKRAESVKLYLTRKGGSAIPSERIAIVAHGQSDPIADNSSESGRAKNRRVQIVLGK